MGRVNKSEDETAGRGRFRIQEEKGDVFISKEGIKNLVLRLINWEDAMRRAIALYVGGY